MAGLTDLLQSLSPEELDTLLQGSLAGDRGEIVQQAMKPYQAMSQTEQPQGRSVGPYHAYVASSPLEHLAAALRQGVGMHELGQGTQAQQALVNQKGQGLGQYLRLAGRMGQGQGQQMPPGDPNAMPDPNT